MDTNQFPERAYPLASADAHTIARAVDNRPTPAEAYLKSQLEAALVQEADNLACGIRHLTVVTGQLERPHDIALVEKLTAAAQRGDTDTRMRTYYTGNDHLTFEIEPVRGLDAPVGAADDFVDFLAALAASLNPGGWRITDSHHYPS